MQRLLGLSEQAFFLLKPCEMAACDGTRLQPDSSGCSTKAKNHKVRERASGGLREK